MGLETSIAPMNTVPVEFWYSSCIILVAILIWVVRIYFAGLQKTIDEIKTNISTLTTLIKIHEHRLDVHDNDINTLKSKRTR